MPPEAIVFDVDGTLAETEEVHRKAFNAIFRRWGLDWAWDRETYRVLLRTTGGKERISAWQAMPESGGTVLTPAEIARLHREKTEEYGRILDRGITLRPGIDALIVRAREAGLRLAVATTTNRPNVERLAQAVWGVSAGDRFDVIAAGDEVAAKKPAPDVYLLALDRLGVQADRAVALEDSRNGVLSARAAGIEVYVVPSAYTAGEDFAGARLVAGGFDDLRILALTG